MIIKGDLIYVDEYGDEWKLTRERNSRRSHRYVWHADLLDEETGESVEHKYSQQLPGLLREIDRLEKIEEVKVNG